MNNAEIIEEIASIDAEYNWAVLAGELYNAKIDKAFIEFLETFREKDHLEYRSINAGQENAGVFLARVHGAETRLDDIIRWVKESEHRKESLDKRKAELIDMLQAKPAKTGAKLTSNL